MNTIHANSNALDPAVLRSIMAKIGIAIQAMIDAIKKAVDQAV